MIPKLSSYCMDCSSLPARALKRRARYAPQLLAEGLSSGIVSDQGNLVHGAFDDVESNGVDPYVDISSDKFAIMNNDLQPVSVDPVATTSPTE